jgi:hypothetical protein
MTDKPGFKKECWGGVDVYVDEKCHIRETPPKSEDQPGGGLAYPSKPLASFEETEKYFRASASLVADIDDLENENPPTDWFNIIALISLLALASYYAYVTGAFEFAYDYTRSLL